MADKVEHYYINPNDPSEFQEDGRSQAPAPSRDEPLPDRRRLHRTSSLVVEAANPPPADRADQSGINNVSPELIAQITERIKKEGPSRIISPQALSTR
jgi:hypothetical protein